MTESVIVGCKLPCGLILELIEPNAQDGKQMLNPRPRGLQYRLAGANDQRRIVGGHMNPQHMPFSTTAIPKDFWEQWLARNKSLAFVRNGTIFVVKDADSARDAAREQEKQRTGFESIDPDKKANDGVFAIEADPKQLQKLRSRAAA